MSWFKGKASSKPASVDEPKPRPAHAHHEPHVSREMHERLAHFLVTHKRLELRNGHPLMHVIGVSHNHHDGSIDYAVRSRIRGIDGKDHRFDSQIRIYATGHLRLLR